ncbi:MAG: hypothetical protein QM811_07435 [Pirellulales bacterium]
MPIACSIHAWMKGYVAVVNHPWAVVTGPDGSFEIKGVPAPGTGVCRVAREGDDRAGSQDQG